MKKLALALAVSSVLVLGAISEPAAASFESSEAKEVAGEAADSARQDMLEAFGEKSLKPGQYLWRKASGNGPARVVVSLGDQLAFLYKGDTLVAVSTISSGTSEKPTPKGIFPILDKKTFHRSIKYDNAPMPFMQMIDEYGIALHAGANPGRPASHGCIRLPSEFAKRLYRVTDLGATVMIGA